MTELPRTTVWIARVQLAAVALVAVIALVGGIAMQLELWEPGPLWSIRRYTTMLGLHGLAGVAIGAPALAGSFGYLAVSHLLGAKRTPAPAVAWIAFGLWVIGVGATLFSLGPRPETDWTFYTPGGTELGVPGLARMFGPLLLSAAGLLYAIHLGAIVARAMSTATPERVVIAIAFVLAIVAACTMGVLDALAASDPFVAPALADYTLIATTAAALVLATATLVDERGPGATSPGATSTTLAVVAVAGAVLWSFTSFSVLGLGVVGVWIALAKINGFGRPSVAFVVGGAGPAIVMLGLAIVLSSGTDVHLHDTHFAVGKHHLNGAIIAFAGLAALHAWPVLRRGAHPLLVWIGAGAVSAGTLLHGFATLRLGASGMPRRYWDYDPQFAPEHSLSGIGAAILVAGLVVLAIAWLVGDRRSTVRA